jgi:hypothetical protein
MNSLLTAVVLWLSANFDLPAIYEHPTVQFVPPAKITALRHGELSNTQFESALEPKRSGERQVVSVYDDATRTIYLSEDWTGGTAGELSILVHETVHHLQNLGGLTFECPRQREQLAYKAQEQWLGLFGSDLAREFELDPFTLLVSTRCFH